MDNGGELKKDAEIELLCRLSYISDVVTRQSSDHQTNVKPRPSRSDIAARLSRPIVCHLSQLRRLQCQFFLCPQATLLTLSSCAKAIMVHGMMSYTLRGKS